jgi:hypothetical protein
MAVQTGGTLRALIGSSYAVPLQCHVYSKEATRVHNSYQCGVWRLYLTRTTLHITSIVAVTSAMETP